MQVNNLKKFVMWFFKIVPFAKSFARNHKQLVLSIGLVLLGILMIVIQVKFKRKPKRIIPEILAPLVKVLRVDVRDIEMVVTQMGTVSPKVEVEIVPEVSGKIVWLDQKFKAGGFLGANEEILRIDSRDYELAVQQAESIVADAQVNLDIQKAEADVAVKEWQQLHPDGSPASPLVLREPQIRQAEAKLQSAQAQLAVAELNLQRTSVSLPIDVRIVSETVDLGQYVMAGRAIGKAYGTEAVEIELPLEDKELAWFNIPDPMDNFNSQKPTAEYTKAEVKADFAGKVHKWEGFVKRTTGQVDRKTRMVSVVVEVPNPFDTNGEKIALLPGTFVEVSIKGNVLKDTAVIPRDALRQGNRVWVVNDERLHIQSLTIARADTDFAYVTDGIKDGTLIVVSSLDLATEGMKVRIQQDQPQTQFSQLDVNHPANTEIE